MGTRIDTGVVKPVTAWRWALFATLLALGLGYIAAYVFFSKHSQNFLVVQRNRAAMAFGAAHPASIPVTWQFGQHGADNGRLGSGWLSAPSYEGVRLLTQDGWLVFVTDRPDTDVLLRLDTLVLTTPAAPRNTIEVSINGTSLGSWQRGGADAREPIDVRVPRSLVADGQWHVRVHVDRIASMFGRDIGAMSNDQNLLLFAVELRKADGSAQPAR
jgi:hypothetical protein